MKKALVLLSLGFAFAGTVGCASAPSQDLDESAPPVAAAEAPQEAPAASIDLPKSEPMAEAPAPAPAPMVSEPPIAKSPSLGASSSGRGH